MRDMVACAEEVVDLLVGEFALKDFVEDYLVGFVGEFEPAWVCEKLVEVFRYIFSDSELFLSEKQGIERCVEFLLEQYNIYLVVWLVDGFCVRGASVIIMIML